MLASILATCLVLSPPQGGSANSRVELTPTLEQLELEEDKEWFGAVRIEGDVPAGAELGVVLEVIFPGDKRVYVTSEMLPEILVVNPATKERFDAEELFQTVADVELSDRLTFRMPAVRSAPANSFFRIRPTGGFLTNASMTFALDGHRTPDFTQPLIIFSEVGYGVELRLELPEDATAAERTALIGRPLAFVGQSQGRFASSDYEPAIEPKVRIEQDADQLIARLDLLPLQSLSYRPSKSTLDQAACLAPFYVSTMPRIEPTPGERSIINVTLTRGLTLSGSVLNQHGRPLNEATVDIACIRSRDPIRSTLYPN